jgi:hypothetical protein
MWHRQMARGHVVFLRFQDGLYLVHFGSVRFHSCITSNTHSIYIITVEKNSEETDQASSCQVAAGVLHRDLTLGIRRCSFPRFGDGTKLTDKHPSREAPD